MEDPDLSATQEPNSSNTLDPTQSLDSTDPTLDQDIDMALDTNPESSNQEPSNPVAEPPNPPPRDPTRKDISLRDFLSKMDEYAPIVCLSITLPHLRDPSPQVSYSLPCPWQHHPELSSIQPRF